MKWWTTPQPPDPSEIQFRRDLAKIRFDRALAVTGDRSRAVFDFALLGLRSLIIINGGALVGLFTFLGNFPEISAVASSCGVHVASLAFVLGLVTALVAVLFSYLAQTRFLWSETQEAEREGLRPIGEDSDERYKESTADHSAGSRRQAVAIGFAIVSLGLFLLGALAAVFAVIR